MNKFVEMSTFVSVVESLSFVGAAAKLGTSKSVVSQRVKMLEKRLAPAYWSAGHGCLTEAGLLFYQECVRLFDEVTLAEEAVAPSRSELRGGLRIATSHTFMTTHLSTILAGFIRDHPGLSLDIATEDRQINMHQPDFDIAIRLGLVPDSTLIARTLARNLTWLCASPDYLSQRGTPLHPVELEQRDGLLYTHRAPGGCWQLLHNGQRQTWRVKKSSAFG